VNCSEVEIVFDPVQMVVQRQQEFQVGFRVRSTSGANEPIATIQMIVQFDPDQLEILPPIPASGGTTCSLTSQCPANNFRCDSATGKCVENPLVNDRNLWGQFGFPMNGIGGPLNVDMTDGDAYFEAAPKLPPAPQPVATPGGLLLGWIRFRMMGNATSLVTVPYTLGLAISEVTDANCAGTGGLGILTSTGSFTAHADCNLNGVADLTDIAGGTSPDCNASQIPDECEISQSCGPAFFCVANCEPDCQQNCVIDVCDILAGRSDDCQSDGIPDDCQNDCNCNGIDDDGETGEEICGGPGVSRACDCNGNGRLDYCEVTPGFCEPDCCTDVLDGELPGSNGVCDECEKCGDVDQNGFITLADLFCVLDAFAGDFSSCSFTDADINGSCGSGLPECCPNGVINLFDLFSVLNAFQGLQPCCDT